MTTKECFRLIRLFELTAGEDYLDYNESIIQKYNLVFWLLGKGYLTECQANYWVNNDKKFIDLNSLFEDYESPNTVFTYAPNKETNLKKIYIMAELISSIDVLHDRLVIVVRSLGMIINEITRKEHLINAEYEYIKTMSITEINNINNQ